MMLFMNNLLHIHNLFLMVNFQVADYIVSDSRTFKIVDTSDRKCLFFLPLKMLAL